MTGVYLAIEKDDVIHERESKFWLSHGISSARVYTMNEGIEMAMKSQFYYIGINGSNVNYMPKLIHLREATNAPILISTSTYTMQEQGIALSLGADLFGEISDNPSDNFNSVVAAINRINDRADKPEIKAELIISGNILISKTRRQVLVGDIEIGLTQTDFDVLYFLMKNRGHVLSPEQIYRYAWDDSSEESINNAIKSAIKRLRKKIATQNNRNSIIETVRGFGYRFPMQFL